jgi:hypothetical protein
MNYKCPVCGKNFERWNEMAQHWVNNYDYPKEHEQWFETHNIDTKSVFTLEKSEPKFSYMPLKEIIEKECKTH